MYIGFQCIQSLFYFGGSEGSLFMRGRREPAIVIIIIIIIILSPMGIQDSEPSNAQIGEIRSSP